MSKETCAESTLYPIFPEHSSPFRVLLAPLLRNDHLRADRRTATVVLSAGHAGKVYRRRFVSTRLAATLLADAAPCFAICACPALVINRDCSYISIHFSLEIAEISVPIASSGKSSGDSK